MKQFTKTNKITYNLMSFTGYKALLVFAQLTDGPKSFKEVSDYFLNHTYLHEKISIDTFRVYMNSLKRLGFEIKRTRGDDKVSRYEIVKHPFELKLSDDHLKSILKVYKNIVKNIDIKELLAMESFFKKIGNYIKNENFIEEMLKISMLEQVDIPLLKSLLDCCDKKDQIVINYNSPNSCNKNIELIADKVEVTNGKIYLYGTSFEHNQYTYFPVSRIKQINEIKFYNKDIPFNLKTFTVTYEYYGDNFEPLGNEMVIEHSGSKYVIEATTSNEFTIRQRLLEMGPHCKIIEPEKFRENFIKLLKDMKAGYYCG